jgi:hypothetical protein
LAHAFRLAPALQVRGIMRDGRRPCFKRRGEAPLPSVVGDVLRGLGFRLRVALLREPPSPDLVLVAVERGQVSLRLAAARDRARGAPVVAVLRASDAALASRALAAGAHAFHALDTSLEHLRDTVLILLGLGAARPCHTTSDRRRRRRATGSPAPAA